MGQIGKPLNANAAKNKQVFDAEVNMLWLDAIQQMKGLGPLTDLEGNRISLTLPDYSNLPETNLRVIKNLKENARQAKMIFDKRKAAYDQQYEEGRPAKTKSGANVEQW